MSSHHHRSTFKKNNKPYKGKSKRTARLNKSQALASASASASSSSSSATKSAPRRNAKRVAQESSQRHKAARVNRTKQLQAHKREQSISRARVGAVDGPPKTVMLLALGPLGDTRAARERLVQHCVQSGGRVMETTNPGAVSTVSCLVGGRKTTWFTFVEAPREATAVLDLAKVADIALFIVTPTRELAKDELAVDELGYHFISLLKAQGLPAQLGLAQGLCHVKAKHRAPLKKLFVRFFQSNFEGKPKVWPLDTEAECTQMMRWLSNQRLNDIAWRKQRSYMFGQSLAFQPNPDGATGTLAVGGFLRGDRPLSADQLVHVTGHGDFQIARIEGYLSGPSRISVAGADAGNNVSVEPPRPTQLLAEPIPGRQQSLQSLADVDPMAAVNEHEQDMITDEEIRAAAKTHQAVWETELFGGLDDNNSASAGMMVDDDDDDSDDAMDDSDDDMDSSSSVMAPKGVDVEAWRSTQAELARAKVPPSDEETLELRRRLEQDEVEFPDEVETPPMPMAKQRFARYRGLQSFHKAFWDYNESLPVEYGRIVRFENFQATCRRAQADVTAASLEQLGDGPGAMEVESAESMASAPFQVPGVPAPKPLVSDDKQKKEEGEPLDAHGIPSGTQVIVYLRNFPVAGAQALCTGMQPAILFALLEHERRVSVLHFHVRRHPDDISDPVRGKDPMLINCGFRRFTARPVFSDASNGNKHLVERFLLPGRFSVATIYGRVMFPPAPVLMFRAVPPPPAGDRPLPPYNPICASGSLMSIDPDRLLIKRVILSGYPVSVSKRTAVVRYMFHNADDIRYFKPVELYTKHGVPGKIREPRGTHGYMKCTFRDRLNQSDTVCMKLYKRQFPPFNEADFAGHV